MAAVNSLESNWISIQEIFELASHVLMWIFVGLWPKKRAEVPETDLKKLAKAFDTPDDPILQMKGRSVKRGAEGAIALTYAHGEEVNWEKVSSSRGRPLSELRVFFEKPKKYAPGIISIISPSAASSTSATWFLRLRRQVDPCLLPMLVLLLPHLPLPWSMMLRWRRLSLPL
jgi:hypothetical protein